MQRITFLAVVLFAYAAGHPHLGNRNSEEQHENCGSYETEYEEEEYENNNNVILVHEQDKGDLFDHIDSIPNVDEYQQFQRYDQLKNPDNCYCPENFKHPHGHDEKQLAQISINGHHLPHAKRQYS